jgi:hypothetical protein
MQRIVCGVTCCTVLLKKKIHRFLHSQTGVKNYIIRCATYKRNFFSDKNEEPTNPSCIHYKGLS